MEKPREIAAIRSVAVLGAGGTMGRGIARNAAGSEIPVHAWNRTAEKLDDLVGATSGVEAFAVAREAVIGADVVVTILSDADATLAAMSGPDGGAAGSEGAVWVQMGTIGVEGSERCAELARDRGLEYVDAPVLGTKKPAEDGQLVILASGPEGPRDMLEPFFDAVGKRTIWLGAAGQGSKLKIVINGWLCSLVEGTAEMLRLAAALGLEPRLALDAIEGGCARGSLHADEGRGDARSGLHAVLPPRARRQGRPPRGRGRAAGRGGDPGAGGDRRPARRRRRRPSRRGPRRPLPRCRRGLSPAAAPG
jgi:3-hydroxyisobutyrate dehydrogenase